MKQTALIIVTLLLFVRYGICADSEGLDSPFGMGAGARELSLGGAAITDPQPSTAAFWNVSSLAHAPKSTASGFHTRLFEAGVVYQYFGLAVPTLDFGTFGAGLFRLGVDDIEKRDDRNLLLGSTSENRLAVYFGYARTISRFDVGLGLSLEHQSIDDYSATSSPGVGVSIGRRFHMADKGLQQLSISLNGRNLMRPGMKLDQETVRLPRSVDASVQFTVAPKRAWSHELNIFGDIAKTDGATTSAAVGTELSLKDLLHLRGGLASGNLSAGFGVSYGPVGFDYAFVERDFDNLHMFSLSFSVGKAVSVRHAEREVRREAEFNSLMTKRLEDKNSEMVLSLVSRGEKSLADGKVSDAFSLLDRALFLARTTSQDTTHICQLLLETGERLEEAQLADRLEAYVDSARTKFEAGDYLPARYFSKLALQIRPGSDEVISLADTIDEYVSRIQATDQLISESLLRIDSLLSYGKISAAESEMKGILEFQQSDDRVSRAIAKVRFEIWRERAVTAFGIRDYGAALLVIDSAASLYPEHPWCDEMRKRAVIEQNELKERVHVSEDAKEESKPLSPELLAEVESSYEEGRELFENGDLSQATRLWETVERIAPGYKAVREYLVKAYKFVGVEHYSQNRLEEAIDVWMKGAALSPDNSEIASYMSRAKKELSKLRELSYGHE